MSLGPLDDRRRIILLALVLTALRLAAGATIHLTEDEAYYRLWAQSLQFGYFDHPPMIAWWIRLGEVIAGDTPLGVRLLPVLSTGLVTWFVGDLTRRLGASPQTALRAALWYNATLTVGLGGMLAIPDSPASLYWIVTLWCLARTWESGRGLWWLAAGAAAGLAVLSKYSALFLAPGVLLWLLLIPRGRDELRRPWPWGAALIAGLIFSVNVLWNAQHEWITFAKQFGRVAAQGLEPKHLAEFLATQFVLLNPIIAVFAVLGTTGGWRQRNRSDTPHLMLPIATSLPFVAYLILHSLHDRVQGHWPAPIFGALAICAAMAAERAPRWARIAAPALGLGLSALILIHLAMPSSFGRSDPSLALRGWPQFATDVEALRRQTGAAWVGAESYGTLSQLEAERASAAPLLQVVERDRYRKDPARRPDTTRPGLIVDIVRRMDRQDLLRCFAQVTPLPPISRGDPGGARASYGVFLVAGPLRDIWIDGCPQ
ncbi:MAG: glycosyltransferase family 39 protein [Phenylobacterium sp.]